MAQLDPQETIFLRFISSFTSEELRDAITQDVDLGVLVVKEYSDEILTEFRHYASLYDITHPGKKTSLSDLDGSTQRVLSWLKVQRPDLGFEIETYAAYPTAVGLGLLATTDGSTLPTVIQSEHVGLAWLKHNIQSLASVLL